MRSKFLREVADAHLRGGDRPRERVTASDLQPLPASVQRYLTFMNVVGRKRTNSLRAHLTGSFRLSPHGRWSPCETWQLTSRHDVSRIFHMRIRIAGVLPMYVRDTYLHGRGRMTGRVLDLLPVVDQSDDEVTTGELVTYLNDAILMAPSMLLGPETTWTEVDGTSFDVALADSGKTVTARVFTDERGAVLDFSTTDRFGRDPGGAKRLVRARWSTPVVGWKLEDGATPIFVRARAIWHFESGDFAYAELTASKDSLEVDV